MRRSTLRRSVKTSKKGQEEWISRPQRRLADERALAKRRKLPHIVDEYAPSVAPTIGTPLRKAAFQVLLASEQTARKLQLPGQNLREAAS